ncbi:hypothetical protein AM231_20615 [Paenibacillus solani]|uniref:Glycosyltransferase n=2 Tax=Paenibacillus solani TaxID=1705565 RepID=A0A0M1NJA7_9BACL|nr:hypothetical protein AM231_20615 [Paenibacillus solani]
MYTRERRGIFRSAEGFDTVARSSGLDAAFIKKVLHPFCQYEAPAELTARSEKEAGAYPPALHLFHTETGETVLGRSVFQPADFTGLRSAFFTHHYVIPDGFHDNEHSAYQTWLQASFADHYDIEEGMDLPQLQALPVQADSQAAVSNQAAPALLQELGIDEKVFKQLVYACISAAAGKKKVYIVLDVPVEQLSAKAEQLLFVLFGRLPYALRRVLGFVTYAKEPQSKKGLHVMFVEKGGLRLGDRSIEKDYLFELAAGRVINVDLKKSEQPYLNFAWDTLLDPERSERFYAFAEQMLADMEPSLRISLDSYDDLCVLFEIEEGRVDLYREHKHAVLRALLLYLKPVGALNAKRRLDQLFHILFAQEFELVKGGHVPDAAIAGYVRDYHDINPREHNDGIVEFFIRSLNNALSKQRQDVTQAIYELLEESPALSRAFYARVLTSPGLPALLFDPYMKKSMQQTATPTDLIDLISLWVRNHPLLLEQENYVRLAEAQLVDKLHHDSEPVSAVNAVLDQLDSLEHHPKQGIGRYSGGTAFADRLIYAANLFLLRELEPEQLSRKQLLDIGFLRMPKEFQAWVERFDSRIRSKAAVMLALYQWCSPGEDRVEEVLADLSAEERERTQHIMRKWLQQDVVSSNFKDITLAFCTEIQSGAVDYRGLLLYLHKHGKSPEVVYQYIEWSVKQPLFSKARGLVPAYANAIVQYFKTYDREAFKNKEYVKTYFSSPSPALKPVYTKVRAELASPFVRFMRRNSRLVQIVSALLVIVMAGGIYFMVQDGKTPADGEADPNTDGTPPVNSQPASPVTDPEQPILTAKTVKGEGEEADKTELIFHFKQPAACQEFKVDKLQIIGKDESNLYDSTTGSELSKECAQETADETNADPAETNPDSPETKLDTEQQADKSTGNTEKDSEAGSDDAVEGGLKAKDTPSSTGAGTGSSDTTENEDVLSSGSVDDVQENQSYTSQVVLKLDKVLDLSLVEKVVADGITYTLADESSLSEEQAPKSTADEGE